MRLTAQEIVENNKKVIADNRLTSWEEVHAYTLRIRLENKENK